MKRHTECAKRCQYAQDVGLTGRSCATTCVYQEMTEQARAASRKAVMFALKIAVIALGAAALLTVAIVEFGVKHGT